MELNPGGTAALDVREPLRDAIPRALTGTTRGEQEAGPIRPAGI